MNDWSLYRLLSTAVSFARNRKSHYALNGEVWHEYSPETELTQVCLAGLLVSQVYDWPHYLSFEPSEHPYLNEDLPALCRLDALRAGEWPEDCETPSPDTVFALAAVKAGVRAGLGGTSIADLEGYELLLRAMQRCAVSRGLD